MYCCCFAFPPDLFHQTELILSSLFKFLYLFAAHYANNIAVLLLQSIYRTKYTVYISTINT